MGISCFGFVVIKFMAGSCYLATVVLGLVFYCSFGVSGLVAWFCCLSGSSVGLICWDLIWVV